MFVKKEKYDEIGRHYDRTRKADLYLVERLYRNLRPTKEGKYLDIGCGTGNYTIALSRRGVKFIGVDPSREMLGKAMSRKSDVEWKFGKSENIPLDNASADGAIACLTIHHWKDLNLSFGEINRVLKPKGRFVIFTSTSKQMEGYWLNHYFPLMLQASAKQMPDNQIIEMNLSVNDFEIIETEKYFVSESLEDLFLYSGKHNPRLYFDKNVRNGISSFSDLANAQEVEEGLAMLRNDVETEEIDHVINRYSNQKGDYLFLVGAKE